MDPVKVAALDIGSNSIHLVVSLIHGPGLREVLDSEREMLRLGDATFRKGRIPPGRLERALEVLKRFKAVAEARDVQAILAVATSAVRDAANRAEFVARVEREARLAVRVVSGEEEGRLIYAGVRDGLPPSMRRIAVIDIGGGSAEVVVGEGPRVESVRCLPLGVLRLAAAFPAKKDPGGRDLVKHARRVLGPAARDVRKAELDAALGTSGTILCVARLLGVREDLAAIRLGPLRDLVDRLRERSPRELRDLEPVGESRADTIVPGALVLQTFMEESALKEIVPCVRALREGVVADYARRNLPRLEAPGGDGAEPRRRSVHFLARKTGSLNLHARQVARLSLILFDALRKPCRLEDRDRELLEYAAILHDAGYWIGAERHHKHAAYLIREGPLEGFTREEILVLAALARYHRGKLPEDGHEEVAALPKNARRRVRALAALLRIADGLDRSHAGLVKHLEVDHGKKRLTLRLSTEGNLELEVHQAEGRADLFEQLFHKKVRFEVVREGQA
jgi:exopolyphosphatase/guanosine-5'-triphosphate,3'-diphosphate pyrophosphatase